MFKWSRMKVPDRIAYLAMLISMVSLFASTWLGVISYNKDKTFNRIQERILVAQNKTKVVIKQFRYTKAPTDSDFYLVAEFQNTSPFPALRPRIIPLSPPARASYTKSKAPWFQQRPEAIESEGSMWLPIGPVQEVEEDLKKLNPNWKFLKLVNSGYGESSPNFDKRLDDELHQKHGLKWAVTSLPIPVVLEYDTITEQTVRVSVEIYAYFDASLP